MSVSGYDGGVQHGDDAGDGFGSDASSADATDDATDAPSFVPPADAGTSSCVALDPAHDNDSSGTPVASPLAVAWTVELGGPPSAPIAVDGLVIVTTTSPAALLALNPASGATVWGPVAAGDSPDGNGLYLAAEGDQVFALDTGGLLAAFDANTGAPLWSVALEQQSFFDAPPVAANGLVFVNGAGDGGTTIAVDASNGHVIWTALTEDGSEGAVAVAGGVVYEAEACDHLSAFDALSGKLLWYHEGDCEGGGGAAPAVFDGHVWERDWASGDVIYDLSGNVTGSFAADFMPSFGGGAVFYVASSTLSRVDLSSGAVGWSFAGDGYLTTSAVVIGNQVLIGSSSGNVYELDATTGTQTSVVNLGGLDTGSVSIATDSETLSMTAVGGHLIVPTSTGVVGL